MKQPASALLTKNPANERQFFVRRGSADFVAGSDQALRLRQLCAAIVMNCDERLVFFYAVADAFVEFEADGVIDGVFLFFAATAQHSQGRAQLFAICCGDEAVGRANDVHAGAGSRKKLWLFDNKIVAALNSNTVLESFHSVARCDHGFSEDAAFVYGIGAFTKEKHPSG